jgi:hypothetical protein
MREAGNLTTFVCRMSWKTWSLNLLEPSGPHQACYGTTVPLPLARIMLILFSFWPFLFRKEKQFCFGTPAIAVSPSCIGATTQIPIFV